MLSYTTVKVALAHVFLTVFVLSICVDNDLCTSWNITYNPQISIINVPATGVDIGFPIIGIDSEGTIHHIGGLSSAYSISNDMFPWVLYMNIFDNQSYISYTSDADVQINETYFDAWPQWWNWEIDNVYYDSSTNTSLDTDYKDFFPQLQHPYDPTRYTSQGAFCFHPCTAQINDVLYVVNMQGDEKQATRMLGIYDMLNRTWRNATTYDSLLPGDLQGFGINQLKGVDDEGCTTSNNTHIFYFTSVKEILFAGASINYTTVGYVYNPVNDKWLNVSYPMINVRTTFSCAANVDGRYIYLFGGARTASPITDCYFVSSDFQMAEIRTEKYDTFTDTWEILPDNGSLANGGRYAANAWTDDVNELILIVGGHRWNCSSLAYETPTLVEVFYLTSDTFRLVDDSENVYLKTGGYHMKIFSANNIFMNGLSLPSSTNSTEIKSNMLFIIGGGSDPLAMPYGWEAQFISILSTRKLYSNGTPATTVTAEYNGTTAATIIPTRNPATPTTATIEAHNATIEPTIIPTKSPTIPISTSTTLETEEYNNSYDGFLIPENIIVIVASIIFLLICGLFCYILVQRRRVYRKKEDERNVALSIIAPVQIPNVSEKPMVVGMNTSGMDTARPGSILSTNDGATEMNITADDNNSDIDSDDGNAGETVTKKAIEYCLPQNVITGGNTLN